jgi:hypothetical protein
MATLHSPERKKSHGIHYTPPALADCLAERMMEYLPAREGPLRVVDPAVGDGALLSSFATACIRRNIEVRTDGFDTDESAVCASKKLLQGMLPSSHVHIVDADYLEVARPPSRHTLFPDEVELASVDVVIANPPYVRTQELGAIRAQGLAEKFDLTGRIDLYQAFIKAISWTLVPGGIAGLIVPNRFMTVRAGKDIRSFLLSHFELLEIWDLGDTRLFEAAVLPAVLILRKAEDCGNARAVSPIFRSVYCAPTSSAKAVRSVMNACEALEQEGMAKTRDGELLCVKHGLLDHGDSLEGVWRLSTQTGDDWLETVRKHTFLRFGDIGKIRVGVKTTADNVFLRTEWEGEHLPDQHLPELLRPVTTHHVARSFCATEVTRKILYPHVFENGKRRPVDLDTYPVSKQYLERHKTQLEERTYVTNSGRKWFELWVPQSPELWSLPKVVFRDISEKPMFWMDLDGTVVNGDCYWIISEGGDPEMLWLLLAVANSTFIEDFYDHSFNNKLYAGRRRFMTQYVETFPLPDPSLRSSQRLMEKAKQIFKLLESGGDVSVKLEELNSQVYECFGLTSSDSSTLPAKVFEACDSQLYPQTA